MTWTMFLTLAVYQAPILTLEHNGTHTLEHTDCRGHCLSPIPSFTCGRPRPVAKISCGAIAIVMGLKNHEK